MFWPRRRDKGNGLADRGSVVVAGTGPKLGLALARQFSADGYRVLMLARRAEPLEALAASVWPDVFGRACDLTEAGAVDAAFAHAEAALGPVACAVFNASARRPGGILEVSAAEFEQGWRVGCLAGFHVGQAAARNMVPRGAGTILFTGATASLKGNAKSTAFAAQKFGLRAVAQSMARDLGPQGIHVARMSSSTAGSGMRGRPPRRSSTLSTLPAPMPGCTRSRAPPGRRKSTCGRWARSSRR